MKLYHYTNYWHLPNIMEQGITKGEVPTSLRDLRPGAPMRMSAPNLTTSTNVCSQICWAGNPKARMATDKTRVRITVDIPDGDSNLVPYRSLCEKTFLRHEHFQQRFDPLGQSKFWWIYQGVIPPAWFTAVEVRGPDGFTTMIPETLENIRMELHKFEVVTDERGFDWLRVPDGTESWMLQPA